MLVLEQTVSIQTHTNIQKQYRHHNIHALVNVLVALIKVLPIQLNILLKHVSMHVKMFHQITVLVPTPMLVLEQTVSIQTHTNIQQQHRYHNIHALVNVLVALIKVLHMQLNILLKHVSRHVKMFHGIPALV
jgi:hypothetical protein